MADNEGFPPGVYMVRKGAEPLKFVSSSPHESVRRFEEEGFLSAGAYGLKKLIGLFRKEANDAN